SRCLLVIGERGALEAHWIGAEWAARMWRIEVHNPGWTRDGNEKVNGINERDQLTNRQLNSEVPALNPLALNPD
ncbi:MAG: hypothetical protein WB495_07430, partial [Xanthobacteraceae bacterium]